MKTNRIDLFYKATARDLIPPPAKDLARKEEFIKNVHLDVAAKKPQPGEADEDKFTFIKVSFEKYNPEVARQQRFFHTAVKYYAIQDMDLQEGEPANAVLRQYREELLDDLLGYDYQTVHRTVHTRKSTRDLRTVQAWNTLLKRLEELQFDAAGYEFPDSEEFWKMVASHGYDQAQGIAIKGLQSRMAKRI